jgi:hypothetical protein
VDYRNDAEFELDRSSITERAARQYSRFVTMPGCGTGYLPTIRESVDLGRFRAVPDPGKRFTLLLGNALDGRGSFGNLPMEDTPFPDSVPFEEQRLQEAFTKPQVVNVPQAEIAIRYRLAFAYFDAFGNSYRLCACYIELPSSSIPGVDQSAPLFICNGPYVNIR